MYLVPPMPNRTPAQEHAMAKTSAFYTVDRSGPASVQDVMRAQGLCELRAKKALEDLVKDGKVFKAGTLYYAKRPVPQL